MGRCERQKNKLIFRYVIHGTSDNRRLARFVIFTAIFLQLADNFYGLANIALCEFKYYLSFMS